MIAQNDRIVELRSQIGAFNGTHARWSLRHTAVTEDGHEIRMSGEKQSGIIAALKMAGVPLTPFRRGYVDGLRVEWPQ